MSSPETTAVSVRDLTVTYGGDQPVIADVDLDVRPGEFVAIAGPNGGGKTTLLRTILGLVRPARGTITIDGEPIRRARGRHGVGYLRQRSTVGVESPVTVREVVASGRLVRTRWFGPQSAADRDAVTDAIARVGLAGRERAQVRRLSGGQQQRVFLARLLASEPKLLLLDEPTTGVDARSQAEFAELLCELNRSLGVTILYVSHEFGAVEQHVDRVVLVSGGIQFDGTPAELPGTWHDPSHDHSARGHVHVHSDGRTCRDGEVT